jgi:HTH-type transcriptional regulator, competence development regulator
MKFGQRLKQLRKARKLTQRALAIKLEMDFAYLSRIENDYFNHLPSRETIERIAKALRLTNEESDELHILAGKIPYDVEHLLFANPKLIKSIRVQGSNR